MEIAYIQRGQYQGRIDVPASLRTMTAGEKWHISPAFVNIASVRNCCSILNRNTGMSFSVSCPGYDEPTITVTRVR